MAKRKLDQYKGRLSHAQITEGMNAASHNARRLAEDAKLLLERTRYPSAATLAILSIEESGKTSILRSLSVARNEKETKDAWAEYRSHTKKNVAWIVPDLVKAGAKKLEDFRPLYAEDAEHPYILIGVRDCSIRIQSISYGELLANRLNYSCPQTMFEKEGVRHEKR